jgi:adhesin transport system membrane fusion protein
MLKKSFKKISDSISGIFNRLFIDTPEERDLTSDIRASILVHSPKGGRIMLWLIVVFFVVAVIWAANSEVEEVTRGTGKVIPSRQIQVVQNLEGGILEEILVREGDIVEKGQLLLRIDDTRFSAPFRESRVKYLALKAKVARLEAEAEGSDFVVPEEIVTEHPEIRIREQELFESRRMEQDKSIAILTEQAIQREQELKELEAKYDQYSTAYRLVSRELELTEPLVKQGAVSEVELLRLKREASKMAGEMEAAKLAIPRIKSQHIQALKQIDEKKLEFQNLAKVELNDAMSSMESMSASSIALQDRLKRTSVLSPVYGKVKQLLVHTVGGVIQPGMDLIEIVPLEDTLLVEARVKPSDIAFLRPNQHATVKFSAYDFTIYGSLEAELEHISADSILDEVGNSYYLVRVRTKKNYIGAEDNPLPIIPGMVATVDIKTGNKTVLSYLLKPFTRAKAQALRER